jgi:hypothetical protein
VPNDKTDHLADNTFSVRECRAGPERGPLYILDAFPYPVPEDELAFEDDE